MRVSVKLDLASFKVPTTVAVKGNIDLRQVGFTEGRKIHVSELDEETLAAMCEEFTRNVFSNAGKVRC